MSLFAFTNKFFPFSNGGGGSGIQFAENGLNVIGGDTVVLGGALVQVQTIIDNVNEGNFSIGVGNITPTAVGGRSQIYGDNNQVESASDIKILGNGFETHGTTYDGVIFTGHGQNDADQENAYAFSYSKRSTTPYHLDTAAEMCNVYQNPFGTALNTVAQELGTYGGIFFSNLTADTTMSTYGFPINQLAYVYDGNYGLQFGIFNATVGDTSLAPELGDSLIANNMGTLTATQGAFTWGQPMRRLYYTTGDTSINLKYDNNVVIFNTDLIGSSCTATITDGLPIKTEFTIKNYNTIANGPTVTLGFEGGDTLDGITEYIVRPMQSVTFKKIYDDGVDKLWAITESHSIESGRISQINANSSYTTNPSSDWNGVLTNDSTSVTATLDIAATVVGINYSFMNSGPTLDIVSTGGGELIYKDGATGTTLSTSDPYATATLYAAAFNVWVVTSYTGNWTLV